MQKIIATNIIPTLSTEAFTTLKTLRLRLHKKPCPSEKEAVTAEIITEFFETHIPDAIVHKKIGGEGIIAEFSRDGGIPGRAIVIRADMDAVPVQEEGTTLAYGHMCGHDGHMANLCATAMMMQKAPISGKVFLLFQPAEENAAGAKAVIQDPQFKALTDGLTLIFIGLHNIPGQPKGDVIISNQHSFSSAVISREFIFAGRASHAANPEEALNPYFPISKAGIILPDLVQTLTKEGIWNKITVVNVEIGKEWNYGTSPEVGKLRMTFRARTNADLSRILTRFDEAIAQIQSDYPGYRLEKSDHDDFPATENDDDLNHAFIAMCKKAGLPFQIIEEPYPWGEDFGVYQRCHRGLFFGLGSGTTNTGLHTATFKFPDDIIKTGARAFYLFAKQLATHAS